jgi:hypothetical protein
VEDHHPTAEDRVETECPSPSTTPVNIEATGPSSALSPHPLSMGSLITEEAGYKTADALAGESRLKLRL